MIIVVVCYIIYDSMPSKYTKLEKSVDGFMNRSMMMRFEFEKSPSHTFLYGGTGTGKTYFVRHYLKLYQGSCFEDQQSPFTDQEQEQK